MKYPFKVYQKEVEGHRFWIAESNGLKYCVGQGDSVEEAVQELEENEQVWLDTANEEGFSIPELTIDGPERIDNYSGKFTVRLSKKIHRDAALEAQKQEISLNQFVNDAVVSHLRDEGMTKLIASIEEMKTQMQTSSSTQVFAISLPNSLAYTPYQNSEYRFLDTAIAGGNYSDQFNKL